MRSRLVAVLLLALGLTLSACAPTIERARTVPVPRDKPVWAFERSDITPEPEYRFGRLENGMRYVVRANANPKGTALVRLEIDAGSLDETDDERGFAHFVEHMAFNGSTHVPEGEMVHLLQRHGLAFGADTNATTSFETTTYMLDLPTTDAALVDVALMLMRETAGELSFAPEAVDRERGVVLAEMRDRNSYQLRNAIDQARFLYPEARWPQRFPIGEAGAIEAASAERLKAFWQREYTPGKATLVVIGDIDPAAIEAAIRTRFADWPVAPDLPQPTPGPIRRKDADRTAVYLDQALSERTTASRNGSWLDEPDSIAVRREKLLRQIGYGVINRRLQRLARKPDPPFRDAGLGTGAVFEAGRTTNLVVDTVDGKWKHGLARAVAEYRRALRYGFTAEEVGEQVANLRTALEDAAASASTRGNGTLLNAVLMLLRDDLVPGSPRDALTRFTAFAPEITPPRVLDALKREVLPLDRPLLRLQGRKRPDGGVTGLRAGWNEAARAHLDRPESTGTDLFAYADFGPPGRIVADSREPLLGIREVRFANGVRLNLRHTDLEQGTVRVQMELDGGDMLDTAVNPLATQMVSMLPWGGLGKHSQDELQTILAGRTVSGNLASGPETFVASSVTTPRDMELQMQLLAALITDPGYRSEGELRYRLNINNFFARLRATPGSALGNAAGGILSGNDPRFTLQPVEDYRKLTFTKLKADLADRLAHGAIELGVVGDIDEDAVIAAVARTLGALPAREADFQAYTDNRQRPFTADRALRVIRHDGPADQAMVQWVWPTRDDSDPAETRALSLLERVARIELVETLRERLGKAYAPVADSAPSRIWTGYGTFSVTVSSAVADLPAIREAVRAAIADLRDRPVSDDLLQRARQPMIEALDNALKNNAGWLSLVDRAQTEADRITRYLDGKAQLMAQTPASLMALAWRWLDPAEAVEIQVLPKDAAVPGQ